MTKITEQMSAFTPEELKELQDFTKRYLDNTKDRIKEINKTSKLIEALLDTVESMTDEDTDVKIIHSSSEDDTPLSKASDLREKRKAAIEEIQKEIDIWEPIVNKLNNLLDIVS